MEQGADKDKTNNEGFSPLHAAAWEGHSGGGQYLVEDAGVDVNKATTAGTGFTTPLHTAVGNNHIDVAVCLMERGMAVLSPIPRGSPILLSLTQD